jgi:hypothetical protein
MVHSSTGQTNNQQCCYNTRQRVVGRTATMTRMTRTVSLRSHVASIVGTPWHCPLTLGTTTTTTMLSTHTFTNCVANTPHGIPLKWTLPFESFKSITFGILNSLHETIAQGVFPHAALLNHSCDPNCILRFGTSDDTNNATSKNKNNYSTRMEIVALRY